MLFLLLVFLFSQNSIYYVNIRSMEKLLIGGILIPDVQWKLLVGLSFILFLPRASEFLNATLAKLIKVIAVTLVKQLGNIKVLSKFLSKINISQESFDFFFFSEEIFPSTQWKPNSEQFSLPKNLQVQWGLHLRISRWVSPHPAETVNIWAGSQRLSLQVAINLDLFYVTVLQSCNRHI